MDFSDIIKRAWRITWQYKVLWVLGLFAGASGTFGGWGSSGYRTSGREVTNWTQLNDAWSRVSSWLDQWAPVLVAAAVALFLIGIVWLVLSIAAQAALAYEVDAVERGGAASLSEGWRVGFHNWVRVFLAGIVLMLPIVLIGLFVAGIAVAALWPEIHALSNGVVNANNWAGLAGFAALAVVAAPILIVLSFVLGNMYLLAVRFIAIEGRQSMDAVRASWQVIRHRLKDVLLMWLITIGLGIGFGIALAIPLGIIAAGFGVTVVVGAWPVSVVLGLVLLALALVAGAAWSTFTSAMWTVFFRRVTGREVPTATVAPPRYPPPSADQRGYYPAPGYPAPGAYAPPPAPPVAPPAAPPVAPPPMPSEVRPAEEQPPAGHDEP